MWVNVSVQNGAVVKYGLAREAGGGGRLRLTNRAPFGLKTPIIGVLSQILKLPSKTDQIMKVNKSMY